MKMFKKIKTKHSKNFNKAKAALEGEEMHRRIEEQENRRISTE